MPDMNTAPDEPTDGLRHLPVELLADLADRVDTATDVADRLDQWPTGPYARVHPSIMATVPRVIVGVLDPVRHRLAVELAEGTR